MPLVETVRKPRPVFGPNDQHLKAGPDGKAMAESHPGLGAEEEVKIRKIRAEQAGLDLIEGPDADELRAQQETVKVKMKQLSRAEEELEKERALVREREADLSAREKKFNAAIKKAEADAKKTSTK